MQKKSVVATVSLFSVCTLGYVLDELPTMTEKHLKIEQQIELMKSWNLQPDFVINIKVILFTRFFLFPFNCFYCLVCVCVCSFVLHCCSLPVWRIKIYVCFILHLVNFFCLAFTVHL